MKGVGDPITLTRIWWEGKEPVTGDVLRTRTGRQYVILKVRDKKLDCMVIPKNETTEGQIFDWEWSRSTRRKHGRPDINPARGQIRKNPH